MVHYQIEFSKKDKGWIPKKRGSDYTYRRVPKSPSFETIELVEEWIKSNYVKKSEYDNPWIDHKIGNSIGHLMLLVNWKKFCQQGGFIDYDGYGDAVDENYNCLSTNLKPSHVTKHNGIKIPVDTKYILWYNR